MTAALPDSDASFFVYVLRNGAGTPAPALCCASRGPWQVVHSEGPLAHGDALRREAALKRDRRFKAELKEKAETE